MILYIIFYSFLVFCFWVVYDMICWRYRDKIEQYKMNLEAERLYKELKKAERTASFERYKNRLVASSKKIKAYQTQEIPQQVGLSMHVREWTVLNKNQKAIDADFEVIDN